MHVLIVGSNKIFSIENFYIKYLQKAGVTVSFCSSNGAFQDFYQRGILNRILFRLGISTIYKTINFNLIQTIQREKPDVVWIFKGMEIYSKTLKEIKALHIKLVNYNPDNPFVFSGRGSGNRNITEAISLFDLHFTYNLAIQKQLDEVYDVPTSILPFGFDISDSVYSVAMLQKEISKVCFLGNPDVERASFIKALAVNGISICVYGHHWSKFINHSAVEIHDAVYGEEVWLVLRKYRVQLNLMRKHNLDSHNMRTFEVPGVGGIMVAPDTTEHRLFFENRKEAFYFENVSDCAKIIKNLLELPKEEAEKIRMAARERSVQSGYSYKDRTLFVKEVLEALVK